MRTTFSPTQTDVPGDLEQPASDAQALSPLATSEAEAGALPYPPSWIDRLNAWVERLPVPAWAFYLALGVGLSLVYLGLLLASFGSTTPTLTLTGAVLSGLLNGMTCAYVVGLIHYLDKSAASALQRSRPVLRVELGDEARYDGLRYQLTTLPAGPTLLASALGVLYSFGALALNIYTVDPNSARVSLMFSPLVAAWVESFNLLIYVLVAVLVYHTLHQLRMVNAIYTRQTHINIFQLGPLYALSGLTARTAVGIGIPAYVWFQASMSTVGTSATDVIQTAFFGVVMAVAFILPLVGAHGLLEREKQRLQDAVAERIEATIARLHTHVDSGEVEEFTKLKVVLDTLIAEQNMVDKLRTWPWRVETAGGVGAVFLAPILIWLLQRILERLGL